ncbi:unnamed protein product, partial [Ixodes hexagonus]
LVALYALLAACCAAPLSPALRPREVAGPRSLNRPFVFFESQRLPRGGAAKSTLFSTASNFGGGRRLSTDNVASAAPADSSEARSEDAVASLIKNFGSSLQEKRRLDDTEESSEEEDDGSFSASALSPADGSAVVSQDQVASLRSSGAVGEARVSIGDTSPVILKAAIQQVKTPVVRSSSGDREVIVSAPTDGSLAAIDGVARTAGEPAIITSIADSQQQEKNLRGGSSTESTAVSTGHGENKQNEDCGSGQRKTTLTVADQKKPANANNNVAVLLGGVPDGPEERAAAQEVPDSAISSIQPSTRADGAQSKVSESSSHGQSDPVVGPAAAGNDALVSGNAAGTTSAEGEGNAGTSFSTYTQPLNVNVGFSAGSAALAQVPGSFVVYENQDEVLKALSVSAPGSLAKNAEGTPTGEVAAQAGLSNPNVNQVSGVNPSDAGVPASRVSSITVTLLNGKYVGTSDNDSLQAPDGADYAQPMDGAGPSLRVQVNGIPSAKAGDDTPASPSNPSTRPVESLDIVVQSAPAVQGSDDQPKSEQQSGKAEDCKQTNDAQHEIPNGKSQVRSHAQVQPAVPAGNVAITRSGESGYNFKTEIKTSLQNPNHATTLNAGPNDQSNTVNTGENASRDIRTAAEDEVLAFLRKNAGVIRVSSQDVKPVSYKTIESATHVGPSPNDKAAAVTGTTSGRQAAEIGLEQAELPSSSKGVTAGEGQTVREDVPVVSDVRTPAEYEMLDLLGNNAGRNTAVDQATGSSENRANDDAENETSDQVPKLVTNAGSGQPDTFGKQVRPGTSTLTEGSLPEAVLPSGSSRTVAGKQVPTLVITNDGKNILSNKNMEPSSDNQRDLTGVAPASAGEERQVDATGTQESAHENAGQPATTATAEQPLIRTTPVSTRNTARGAIIDSSEAHVSPSGVFPVGAQGTHEQLNNAAAEGSLESGAKSPTVSVKQAAEELSDKEDDEASSTPAKTRAPTESEHVTAEARAAAEDEILSFLRDRAPKTKQYHEESSTLANPFVVTRGESRPEGAVEGAVVGAFDGPGLLNQISGVADTIRISEELEGTDKNVSPQSGAGKKNIINQQVNIADRGSTATYADNGKAGTTEEEQLPIKESEVSAPSSTSDETKKFSIDISHEQKPIDVSGIFKPVIFKPATPGNVPIDVSEIATPLEIPSSSSADVKNIRKYDGLKDSGTYPTPTNDPKTVNTKDDCNRAVVADEEASSHEKKLNTPLTPSNSRLSSNGTVRSTNGTSENVQVVNEAALQLSFKEGSGNTETKGLAAKSNEAAKGVVHVTLHGDEAVPTRGNVGSHRLSPQFSNAGTVVSGSPYGSDVVKSLSFQEGNQASLNGFSLNKGTPSVTEFRIEDTTANTVPGKLASSEIGQPPVTTAVSHQEDGREVGGEDKPESHASGITTAPQKSILTVISNMFSNAEGDEPKADVDSQKNTAGLGLQDKPAVHPDNISVGVHRGAAVTVEAQGQPITRLHEKTLGVTDGQVFTPSFVGSGNIEQNPLLRDSSAFIDEPKSEDGNYGQRIPSRGQSSGPSTALATSGTPDGAIIETLTSPTITEDSTERDKSRTSVSRTIFITSSNGNVGIVAPYGRPVEVTAPEQGQPREPPIVSTRPATLSVSSPVDASSATSVVGGQIGSRPALADSSVPIPLIGSLSYATQTEAELVSSVGDETHGGQKLVSEKPVGVTTTNYSQLQKSVQGPDGQHGASATAVTSPYPSSPGVVDGSTGYLKTLETSAFNNKTNTQKQQNTIVVHVSDLNSPLPESVVAPKPKVLPDDPSSKEVKGQQNVSLAAPVNGAGDVSGTEGGTPGGVLEKQVAGEVSAPRQAGIQPASILPDTEAPAGPASAQEFSLHSVENQPGNVVPVIATGGEVSLQPGGKLPDDGMQGGLPTVERQPHQQPPGALQNNPAQTERPHLGGQVALQTAEVFPGDAVSGQPTPPGEVNLQRTASLPGHVVPSRLPTLEGQSQQQPSGTLPDDGIPSPVEGQVNLQPTATLPGNVVPSRLPTPVEGQVNLQPTATLPGNVIPSRLPTLEGQSQQQPSGTLPDDAIPSPVKGQVNLKPAGTLPDNAVPGGIAAFGRVVGQQPTGTFPENSVPSASSPVNEQARQQPPGSLSPSPMPEGLRSAEEQVTLQPAGFLPDNPVAGGLPRADVVSIQPPGPVPVSVFSSVSPPVGQQAHQQPSGILSNNAVPTGQPPFEVQTTPHLASALLDDAVPRRVPPVGGSSLQPTATSPDSTVPDKPPTVEDQNNLQPVNNLRDNKKEFVELEPAVAEPAANTLPNQSNVGVKEMPPKGIITVAVDGLQVPAAVLDKPVKSTSASDISNTPSGELSKQTFIVPPINKESTSSAVPVQGVPAFDEAPDAVLKNNLAPTSATSAVIIPQDGVQPDNSNQAPGSLLNTVAGKPPNASGSGSEKTPGSTVEVKKINIDGLRSTQVYEPVKTEVKDEAGTKAGVSRAPMDKPGIGSSSSSTEGTPTDNAKGSFVTYATEPTSRPVSSQEGSTEKGVTAEAPTVTQQTSHQVSTIENVGTITNAQQGKIEPAKYSATSGSGEDVTSLLYHGFVSASNGATIQSTHLLAQPAGTNPPGSNVSPSGVQSGQTTAFSGQNNVHLVSSAVSPSLPLKANQDSGAQRPKTPLDGALAVAVAPHTTVLGDSLHSVHTPSKPTVLKLQTPYVTRFFPNQLPQHTIPPTPPAVSRAPGLLQPGAPGQPHGPVVTTAQGGQPHTRIFFSPPSQSPNGQKQSLAAPPYFVSFRHDYANPNKAPFPQSPTSYATKQKVPAEILLPQPPAQQANAPAAGGDQRQQSPVRPQRPSPPAHRENQQAFAPPSYNPGFSPQFALAPGYRGPVTTIILNPDLSSQSPYQFRSYVPRSETKDQRREGLYKVRSFVPSVSATVPGSPKYTATSFVPDKLTSSQGGQVFKVTSFVPRRSQPVQGYRQPAQLISNVPRSFPATPRRTVYRVASAGPHGSQPAPGRPGSHVTVLHPERQPHAPPQRAFRVASFAPQARVAVRQGLELAAPAQARFLPIRGRGQQTIVEVRAVPIHFEPRPALRRVTPSFHQQPLTFYDVPQRQPAATAPLRPPLRPVDSRAIPDGRARFQPIALVRKPISQGHLSSPQPLTASAAHQAPVFYGVTRVVVKPAKSVAPL